MDSNYFPRGGAQDTPVIKYKKFVFEKQKPTKSKKKKKDAKPKERLTCEKFIRLPDCDEETNHVHIRQQDLTASFHCLGAVHSAFDDAIILNLPCGLRGHISSSSISAPYSKLIKSDGCSQPLSKMFFVGQLLSCKVIGKSVKASQGNQARCADVSVDPTVVNKALNAGLVRQGSIIQMAVSSLEDRGYMLDSGIPGVLAFLPLEQATEYSKKIFKFDKPLLVGSLVWCSVVKCQTNTTGSCVVQVELCHKESDQNRPVKFVPTSNLVWPGLRVNTTITKVFPDGCCEVLVDKSNIFGSVNSLVDFNKDPNVSYEPGSSLPATVISYNSLNNTCSFSFSHFVCLPEDSMAACRAFNNTCLATIDYADDKFIHLSLEGKTFKSYIPIKVLQRANNGLPSNQSTQEADYKAGDRIKVKIKNTDFFSRKYFCFLVDRSAVVDENEEYRADGIKKKNTVENSKKNKIVKQEPGSDSGIDNSYPETDLQSNMKKKKKNKRDPIKIEDSETDSETLHSNVEVKNEMDSDVENGSTADADADSKREVLEKKKKKKKKSSDETTCLVNEDESKPLKKRKSDNDSSVSSDRKKVKRDDSLMEDSVEDRRLSTVETLTLHGIDSQFLWDATPEDLAKVTSKDVEELKEDSEEEVAPKKALTKKQKKEKELEKERKIREKEEELLKALDQPSSADHYERLILSRPDDSMVWIKYMAFHLEATEIEKARAVASRGLKTISHRNEQDRLNIWLALLNLEHLYGSKELFKETWSEALKCNDDYKVNCKVLDLLAGSHSTQEVNSLVQKMTKQYCDNSDCWYVCLSALMSSGMVEKARDLLQRALKSLLPKNHVTLISRFALLENTHGHSEEAQALFDNLLTSYPARVDIWFVYADMLTKSDRLDLTRHVFERATSLKLPAKKMKSIYKKWLEFEEKHGNEESVESVRRSAVQYVEQASKDVGL